MKARLVAFFIWAQFFAAATAHAQRDYYAYDKGDKQLIFYNDFENDNVPYRVTDGKARIKIEDNYFSFRTDQTELCEIFLGDKIDYDQNFEIETNLQMVDSSNTNLAGVIMGDSVRRFRFGFSSINEVTAGVSHWGARRYDFLGEIKKVGEANPYVDCTQPTILTIRRVADSCYFFANRRLFCTAAADNMGQGYMGFYTAGMGGAVKSFYIRASYINGPSAYDFITADKRKDILKDNFLNNNNDWPILSANLRTSLGDGYYEVINDNHDWNGLWIYSAPAVLADFELEISETSLTVNNTITDFGLWFAKDSNSGILAKLSPQLGFTLYNRYSKGKENILSLPKAMVVDASSKLESLNKYGSNKITVRRLAGKVYIFLNEKLVFFSKSINIGCGLIGVEAIGNSTIRIDKIRFSELKTAAQPPVKKDFTPRRPHDFSDTSARHKVGAVAEIDLHGGKFYALIMGAQNYSGNISSLDYPIRNAESLYNVLNDNYRFDKIILLKDPTHLAMGKALQDLRRLLTKNDNLLVYYAGHGCYSEQAKQGYWTPTDVSNFDDYFNMMSNSDIKDWLALIPSLHTLLISDACFSGAIFHTREVVASESSPAEVYYKTKSCTAMTSGANVAVPDRSAFSEYLVTILQSNREKYLPAQTLYALLKPRVVENLIDHTPVPQTGMVVGSYDNGGDFIFIRK